MAIGYFDGSCVYYYNYTALDGYRIYAIIYDLILSAHAARHASPITFHEYSTESVVRITVSQITVHRCQISMT